MTWRQWWIHLRQWFRSFPRKNNDDHTYVGLAGTEHWKCLVCKKEETTTEDTEEDDVAACQERTEAGKEDA
jgi:hypothetical protein